MLHLIINIYDYSASEQQELLKEIKRVHERDKGLLQEELKKVTLDLEKVYVQLF